MVLDAMRFDTLAIHAGQEPDPTTGAIMTPVYLSSTYVQAGPGEHKGYEYSRTRNPTRTRWRAASRRWKVHGSARPSPRAVRPPTP
jgi:cystathionine beta-lyase/cystathionine gamma-synthase